MEFNATFIVAFISFIIFTVVMNLILYKPIDKIVSERQKLIDDNYLNAKNATEEAKRLIEHKDQTIKSARLRAGAKIKSVSDEAKRKGEKTLKETKKLVQDKAQENQNKLAQESINAKVEIKSELNDIVGKIVSKILDEENVEISLDENKINQYLKL